MYRYKPIQDHQFKLDSLTVFSFMWAIQGLIHQETFQDWLRHGELLGTLLTATILLVLLRPWSIVLFGAMVTLNLCDSFAHLPYRVNHILFEDLVNLTILSALFATG